MLWLSIISVRGVLSSLLWPHVPGLSDPSLDFAGNSGCVLIATFKGRISASDCAEGSHCSSTCENGLWTMNACQICRTAKWRFGFPLQIINALLFISSLDGELTGWMESSPTVPNVCRRPVGMARIYGSRIYGSSIYGSHMDC